MFSYLLIRPHQKFIFSMFSTLYLFVSTKRIQRNTDTYYSKIIEMAGFPEPYMKTLFHLLSAAHSHYVKKVLDLIQNLHRDIKSLNTISISLHLEILSSILFIINQNKQLLKSINNH